MSRFAMKIRPFVEAEFHAAETLEAAGKPREAFLHLERAHVLGQASTSQHVRAHWRMFLWACRQRDVRELVGQVVRIIGAATKTAIGLVPEGNTGGASVSPFRRMPLPEDLATIIRKSRA